MVKSRRTGYGRRRVGLYGRPWGAFEKKYKDTFVHETPLAGPGFWDVQITSINNLLQGADVSERLGEKFNIKSIDMDFTVYGEQLEITGPNVGFLGPIRVSVAMVLDKQSNGTAGTVSASDIWQNVQEPGSKLNMANSHRFSILRRWDVILEPKQVGWAQGGTGAPQVTWSMAVIKKFIKCNIPIMQEGSLATEANIKSNNISIWCHSFRTGSGPGTPPVPNCSFDFRIRYTDA